VFHSDDLAIYPCTKLLAFDFTDDYDSDICNNFAKGDPVNDPSIDGDVLCLNGEDQFLQVRTTTNSCHATIRDATCLIKFMTQLTSVQCLSCAH